MRFDKCEKIFDRVCKKKKLHEAVIYIEDMSGEISWNKGYHKTIDSPMDLASITKLFVTTCILQLYGAQMISLEDPISKWLDADVVKGLHVYRGVDYSNQLTIKDLLFQVSGLPDYYLKPHEGGESFEQMILKEDRFIPFDEMIRISKTMKPVFEPRRKGRSYYADINFDLLGKILENIYHRKLQDVYRVNIFEPLGLKSTYAVMNEEDVTVPIYHKGKPHVITKFLSSVPASGGGVTTAREFMIFMKAFWSGKLFDRSLLSELKEHNKLQLCYGSIRYSGGHMYIHAGYPFVEKNELRGHSGSTGSIAYYCEKTGMFFVGDLCDSRVYIPANMMLRMEYHCR